MELNVQVFSYLNLKIWSWTRKANHCNYELISVPADPMAEPFTEKSDPLRGPIFIPLSEKFLSDKSVMFGGM